MSVGGQAPERLDLAQVVHLLETAEKVLHALDCDVFTGFDALGFEHLAESAFALFGY